MAVELDENKKAHKEIYNDAVKLLELLNIFIPKIESFDSKVPPLLIQELATKCWELGGELAVYGDSMKESEKKVSDDEEDEEYFGCFGC